jgi:hypothetical protein
MNITLKQSDIEKAVRMYIERQGFHLQNKTLGIDFSMGRGVNGLSAALSIEDSMVIPGFTDQVDPGTDAPSQAVQAMLNNNAGITNKVIGTYKVKKAVVEAEPVVVEVDEVLEVAKVAPATLAETIAAVAAVATPETEAAKAEPIAEAKVTELTPALAVVAEAQAKPTTSLFG